MKDIIIINKPLKNSGLLIKGLTQTIENETEEQRAGFLGILLSTLCAGFLENMLRTKSVIRADGEVTRSEKDFQFFPLTNLEMQKYHQNQLKFKGFYSQNNLPKSMKDGAYVVNLYTCKTIGTHWITLYANGNNAAYFENIITNIFRIRAHDLIMCGYFCIGFTDFMFKGNSLTDVTNLFCPF